MNTAIQVHPVTGARHRDIEALRVDHRSLCRDVTRARHHADKHDVPLPALECRRVPTVDAELEILLLSDASEEQVLDVLALLRSDERDHAYGATSIDGILHQLLDFVDDRVGLGPIDLLLVASAVGQVDVQQRRFEAL